MAKGLTGLAVLAASSGITFAAFALTVNSVGDQRSPKSDAVEPSREIDQSGNGLSNVAPRLEYLDPTLRPTPGARHLDLLGAGGRETPHVELGAQGNPIYSSLQDGLAKYQATWSKLPQAEISASQTLRRGDKGPAVDALARRLGIRTDPGTSFGVALEAKVRSFQEVHALHPSGVADAETIAALNRGSRHYEEIIRANMERARWLPHDPGSKFVLVNTAAARLLGYQERRPVLEMKVALGSTERPTPALADKIETVVLNPEWNVPPHLVQSAIAPRVLQEGLGYLEENGYVVLSDWTDSAVPADPASVDWQAVRSGRAYARVRQNPGPTNPMGGAKFMFPNRLGIYLHDTPAREVFADTDRYVSNGCVRVERAEDLTGFLLTEEISLPAEDGARREISLPEAIPVFTAHFTFWADGKSLRFYDDVYQKDARLLAQLDALKSAKGRGGEPV